MQRDAEASILLLFADETHVERARVEDDTIVANVESEDLFEDAANVLLGRLAETEKIQVARRTVGPSSPDGEERGALQYEARAMGRHRQAIEKTLVGVARQEKLKIFSALTGDAEQTCSNGGTDVLGRLGHARASMYGRMTLYTRSARAASTRASVPVRCFRR
jgi:hypothetical protein